MYYSKGMYVMTNVNNIVPNIASEKPICIHFRDENTTSITPQLKKLYKEHLPLDLIYIVGWKNLDHALLTKNPKYIAFNINSIIHHDITISKMMAMMQTRLKLANLNIPIVVSINKDSPLHYISEIKNAGAHGIIATIDFGMEETIISQEAVINGIEYWPEHIINQLPIVVQKPIHIYVQAGYNDVTVKTPEIVDEYNHILPVDVRTCHSFEEFDELLKLNPHQIAIHIDTLISYSENIYDIIRMIQTRLKLGKLNIPIAIVVPKTAQLSIINGLKKLGIQNIVPYHGDWDPALVMAGLYALTNRQPFWPEYIIDQLPSTPLNKINVYFRKDWRTYVTPEMTKNVKNKLPFETRFTADWDELGIHMSSNVGMISCHISMIKDAGVSPQEFVSMIETMIKMTWSDKKIPIGVGINKDTNLALIKELQKSGVCGIIPSASDFNHEETVEALTEIFNHRPYWPKHILNQLPGAVKKIKINIQGIKLTNRQEEVLDLVCKRGLSNKSVAKMLNISESTVKIHVSAIMRAYGVRNRTQLALSASSQNRV